MNTHGPERGVSRGVRTCAPPERFALLRRAAETEPGACARPGTHADHRARRGRFNGCRSFHQDRPRTSVNATGRYTPSPKRSSALSMEMFFTNRSECELVASTETPPRRQTWAAWAKLPTSAVPAPTVLDSTTLVLQIDSPNSAGLIPGPPP